MGKGIGANDGFVGLHRHAGEVGDQAGGLVDLLGLDSCEGLAAVLGSAQVAVEVTTAHMQRHHKLFQRGIAGTLTDAIDGALELPCTIFDSFQEVGHGQAQVVVAMHGDHRLADVGHMGVDAGDQGTKFSGCGVAHRVGNIDRGGPSRNRRFDHLVHEFGIAAPGVLAGELHVFHQGAGIGHHLWNDLQHLGAALAQLVLQVNVAGGQKGVNALARGRCHGIGASFDVAACGTGQAANHGAIGAANLAGNGLHRIEVARARERKSGLDDVDAQAGQLLSNGQLFIQIQAGPRRLFPIPEGGVEDQHPARVARHTSYAD